MALCILFLYNESAITLFLIYSSLDKNGFTPLMNAIMTKKDTIIKILIENKNIDVNIQHVTTKMNALMYSLQYHSKFDISTIVSLTTNLEEKDKYGIPAIMYSVK